MNDQFEEDDLEEFEDETAEAGGETQVLDVLKRMQQQLAFLEKKIDTLLSQSSGGSDRPRFNDRRFNKPNRPFGNSYGGRDFQRGGGRGGFDKPRRDDSRGNDNRGNFSRGKKKFFRGDR